MSESYKTHADGMYFVTFSVVGWIDVFIRRKYQDILIECIRYCQQHKDFRVYCYCIMPSHLHFLTYSENGSLSNILRDFKSYTAKLLIEAISSNWGESRRKWMLNQFKFYGSISPQEQVMQFWQHSNHPFYLYSAKLIQQKMDYIHYNPVEAGFVNEPHEWRLSSANENSPVKLDEIGAIAWQ